YMVFVGTSRRRHTRSKRDWSSDVCSSDLKTNVKAGVVINPGTSVDAIIPVLKMVDYVLVMTVNPGFGGQTFIQESIDKLDQLDKMKKELNLSFEIEVDGGINEETVATVIEHGATMLVAGSYFFKQKDYKQVTQTLKG